MPLHFRENLYQGVNAHLQSHYQAHGDWSGFHTAHITDLARAISVVLPAAYVVNIDKSLQLREFHPDTGEKIYRPEPDVTIHRQQVVSPLSGSRSTMPAMTYHLPLIESVFDEDALYYRAVTIYEARSDAMWGKPVTQIELLSPSNKPGGSGYTSYLEKRYWLLRSGLMLVEIDYLHETPPPISGITDYRQHGEQAFPYYVAISDPRPAFEQGQVGVLGIQINQPIAALSIPLLHDDSFMLNLNDIYQQTFSSLPAFWQRVDYAQPPDHFERYHPADQDKIKAVMARAHQKQEEKDSSHDS